MGSDWSPKTLSEIAIISSRKLAPVAVDKSRYISTDNMIPNLGGTAGLSKLPATGKVTAFEKGDVLFSNIRTYFKKIWLADKNGACSNDVLVFRPQDKIPPEYLYYILSNDDFINYTVATSKGTKMPRGDKQAIMNYPLSIPPISECNYISCVLRSLDKKIELNRKINKTLEQMAQALFKSWFVDFDPVIDNALTAGNPIPDALQKRAERRQQQLAKPDHKPLPEDIRQLFPSEFELTEALGWVPKGWEAKTLKSIAHGISGYAFKSKDFLETGVAVIKIKNIKPNRCVDILDVNRISPKTALATERFLLSDGDIIMAMTGATVGKFGIIVTEDREAYYLNQRVCKLSPKSKYSNVFLYAILNRPGVEDGIIDSAQGSAQPNISTTAILSTSVIAPADNLINLFTERMKETYMRRISLKKQEFKLIKLRDALLPKLISGELRIPSDVLEQECSSN